MNDQTTSPLLEVSNLDGGYGDTRIVRAVSFRLQRGQVLGVLGRNGVGKTTLIRLLMGYLPAMAGEIRFKGRLLGDTSPHSRNRLGIGYAPQEGVIFDGLTVHDNLTLHRNERHLDAYSDILKIFPRVRERMFQSASTLSGGEKKLVSFCRTMVGAPALTLLDEPTEGVQPENIDLMARVIAARRAQGASFIVVEQNITFLLAIISQILVLDHGDVTLSADAADVSRETLEAKLWV